MRLLPIFLPKPFRRSLCVVLAAAAIAPPSVAGEAFPGPVRARVLRVIDGDTLTALAHLWPGHVLTVNVRLRGIDAPEMKARCEGERVAAERARSALAELVGERMVALTNIAGAKYYGRVLADVATEQGEVAAALLGQAVVRPHGARRRSSWC